MTSGWDRVEPAVLDGGITLLDGSTFAITDALRRDPGRAAGLLRRRPAGRSAGSACASPTGSSCRCACCTATTTTSPSYAGPCPSPTSTRLPPLLVSWRVSVAPGTLRVHLLVRNTAPVARAAGWSVRAGRRLRRHLRGQGGASRRLGTGGDVRDGDRRPVAAATAPTCRSVAVPSSALRPGGRRRLRGGPGARGPARPPTASWCSRCGRARLARARGARPARPRRTSPGDVDAVARPAHRRLALGARPRVAADRRPAHRLGLHRGRSAVVHDPVRPRLAADRRDDRRLGRRAARRRAALARGAAGDRGRRRQRGGARPDPARDAAGRRVVAVLRRAAPLLRQHRCDAAVRRGAGRGCAPRDAGRGGAPAARGRRPLPRRGSTSTATSTATGSSSRRRAAPAGW